jgi:hypothetical protein
VRRGHSLAVRIFQLSRAASQASQPARVPIENRL